MQNDHDPASEIPPGYSLLGIVYKRDTFGNLMLKPAIPGKGRVTVLPGTRNEAMRNGAVVAYNITGEKTAVDTSDDWRRVKQQASGQRMQNGEEEPRAGQKAREQNRPEPRLIERIDLVLQDHTYNDVLFVGEWKRPEFIRSRLGVRGASGRFLQGYEGNEMGRAYFLCRYAKADIGGKLGLPESRIIHRNFQATRTEKSLLGPRFEITRIVGRSLLDFVWAVPGNDYRVELEELVKKELGALR